MLIIIVNNNNNSVNWNDNNIDNYEYLEPKN